MFSFRTLAIAATLALSTFTTARPLKVENGVLARAPILDVLGGRAEPAAPSSVVSEPAVPSVAASAPATPPAASSTLEAPKVKSLPAILGEVITEATPLFNSLRAITKETNTVEVIAPIVADLTNILNAAINNVNLLIDEPAEVVLATTDGLLDIGELAKLLGPLLQLVFAALGSILSLLGDVRQGEIFNLIAGVGALVGELLALVLALVSGLVGGLLGGLLNVLLPIITGVVVPVLTDLGLTDIVAQLQL